jgi:hypothetical protein
MPLAVGRDLPASARLTPEVLKQPRIRAGKPVKLTR